MFKFKKYLLLGFIITFMFSCLDNKEEEESVLPDSWIAEIDSIEDDNWRYILGVDENNDYLAVTEERILKVDKEGNLIANLGYDYDRTYPDYKIIRRIFDNQIFVFSSSSSDYESNIVLSIYNDLGNLLESVELDVKGVLEDVEIQDKNTYGIIVYEGVSRSLKLFKTDKVTGVISQVILGGNSIEWNIPDNLHISNSGEYICTNRSDVNTTDNNLCFLDENLNLKWAKKISGLQIEYANPVPGIGIYISGSVKSNEFDKNYVALISEDGEEIFRYEYESNADNWEYEMWTRDLKVSSDGTQVAVLEAVVELATHSRVLIFDKDLNLESTLEIEGNVSLSNLVENENGSFSFMYGIKADSEDEELFPITNPRFFKLNKDFVLPETYIYE